MDSSNAPAPDLQSILATLAQYAPPTQSAQTVQNREQESTTPDVEPTSLGLNTATLPARPQSESAPDPRLRPQSRSTASPKPVIDPATITTWQEGLRCVTKIAAQNASFVTSIRRMIEEQKTNEMRWYSERQAVKQRQSSRASSTAKAQAILQSFSTGTGTKPAETGTAINNEAELADFDQKIYSAQQDMEVAMTAELKGLGVPFFSTDATLLVPEGETASNEQPPGNHPKWSPRITQSELLALRRRMVGHLEDLYRD